VDSLNTFFFVGTAEQDGLLTESDYEAPVAEIPGVVMPVPADMNPGDDGSFSFDVTSQLQNVLTGDTITVFSIQGRVDESLAGQGYLRGLEVRTTADGNRNLPDLVPKLSITTPGVVAPSLAFAVTSLPSFGTLFDFNGTQIEQAPTTLDNPKVTYVPNQGTTGTDSFEFSVFDGVSTGFGVVTVLVIEPIIDPCVAVGREPGCYEGKIIP
jgi:hypothetical protein